MSRDFSGQRSEYFLDVHLYSRGDCNEPVLFLVAESGDCLLYEFVFVLLIKQRQHDVNHSTSSGASVGLNAADTQLMLITNTHCFIKERVKLETCCAFN